MAFDIDTGNDGSQGPWIAWSARGTQDRVINPESFYLRDEGVKTPFDGFAKGVVLDIENMKTGWQKSEGMTGVAPEWKWNATVAQMMPQPGDDYKKGFTIPCAIGGGRTASWEQAGAAVWNAFAALVPALREQPGQGKLPLVRMTGTKAVTFKRGSTVEPVLEVVKWVDRPDCLKAGVAVDTGDSQPAARPQQPAQPQQPQPAPAAADDDMEF